MKCRAGVVERVVMGEKCRVAKRVEMWGDRQLKGVEAYFLNINAVGLPSV